MIKESEIEIGSIWTSCDGAGIKVKVISVMYGLVTYQDLYDKIIRDKNCFAFQVRYKLLK
jgi:hypothetical protein